MTSIDNVAGSSKPVTDTPRVGLAVFVVDDRNFVLLGKRKGSLGSGRLALPGGHLELHESFEHCAHREILEETGISLDKQTSSTDGNLGDSSPQEPSISFLTAVNTTLANGAKEDLGGKHYVTVFMKGRVTRKAGQREVEAKVLEPTKCDGWVWVPLSYLFSLAEAQQSIERMDSSASQSGLAGVGVSKEQLLRAERLGARIASSSGSRGEIINDLDNSQLSPTRPRRDTGAGRPRDAEEVEACQAADQLAQGASLFRPLLNVLFSHGDLIKRELSSSPRSPLPPPLATPIQLPPSVFPDEASSIINQSLSAPPSLRHSLTLTFPLPSPTQANDLASILSVDRPLRPNETSIIYTTSANVVTCDVKTTTVRLLRLVANSVLEDVSLVLKTMEAFPGPQVLQTPEINGASDALEEGEAFEEGTVGRVEQAAVPL